MNELDNAIKVALKTKQGKQLTSKQSKAVKLLKQNGFKITDGSKNSSYGYNMISKVDNNGYPTLMYISRINRTKKAGVFIEGSNVESFYHDTVVGCDETKDNWNNKFEKLGYVYDNYNLLDEFNKFLN